MTKAEQVAFDAGVMTIVNLAKCSSSVLELRLAEKPTRFAFAIEALLALAEEGRELLKGRDPSGGHGAELVVPTYAGDDGNFGLTDSEISRPSRERIIGWLSGRTPMLASHWSRIAAKMIMQDAL
jgi:hypothetical protein